MSTMMMERPRRATSGTLSLKASRRRARRYMANDNDAFIPELWSRYTVAILEKYMVAGKLVHRDFEDELKMFGDTVNTRRPNEYTADRKTDDDTITAQDATANNIAVKLNMHPYVSFIIKDGEQSLSMERLVERHLDGAVKAMTQFIDASVTGQVYNFLKTAGVGGTLGGLTSTTYQKHLTETVLALDNANCPVDGRRIMVTPNTKSLILQNQNLVAAYARGDGGTALETADMGMIYGVQHYMTQNMRSVLAADVLSSTFLINNTAGYQVGDTALVVDGGTGIIPNNAWIVLNGKPYRVVSHTETIGNTTGLVITPGLRVTTANNDPLTVYDAAAVNLIAGYAAGWSKAILYDGATILPKVGQGVTFGTASTDVIYTIVQVDATHIWLDRALEVAIANDDAINLTPPGEYNLCFVRDAIALVCRPLEAPRMGAGAISVNIMHAGYPLRIVIAYDYKAQGHAVTIDALMGVKVLDNFKGAVLLG